MTPDAGVSVVVAVHNGASSIEKCLWSILRQTADCLLEVIVVDDASTDDTRVRVTAISDSRVRLIELATNQGVSAARNIGVAAASHDWVAFNDHDDVWLPDKLELQLQLLREVPAAGGCGGGNGRLAADGSSQWRFRPLRIPAWTPLDVPSLADPPFYQPLRDGHIYLQSLLVRKSDAQRVMFNPDLPLWEDWDFILRLARDTTLVCVQREVFLYHLGYANTTAPGKMRTELFLACEAYIHRWSANQGAESTAIDTSAFLKNHVPGDEAIRRSNAAQAIRRVNTVWVAKGLGHALIALLMQFVRQPQLTLSYIMARLRR